MPLGSLRQQLLFPTDCPKVWPSQTRADPLALQHQLEPQQQDPEQQQDGLESSPLLGGSTAGSSTAVKPSGAVQRGAGHAKNGSTAGGRRHSVDPEQPASTPTAAAALGASAVLDMGSGSDAATIDQQLQALLVSVRLGHLLHRFPTGLDAEVDWASVLSLGEQQRVALVRLLFHAPLLAFLDEATAALDPKSEAVAYGLMTKVCSCFVSVGHRLQLLEWHSHVLVSTGSGVWAKYTAAEYRQRLAAGLEG